GMVPFASSPGRHEPQRRLCDQKSAGSSPRRGTVQSLTTAVHVLPPSAETSIRYLTSGRGGLPDSTWAAACSASGRSPRGAATANVTPGLPNLPSTTCACAWGRFGPADSTACPEARKRTAVPLSFSRGMTLVLAWQTVV